MVDIASINREMESEKNPSNSLPNGLANGTSESKSHLPSSEHKSKRDKDRHSHKHKHGDKDKDKSKDKDRHSSSHKSSHRDRDKDHHREKSDTNKHDKHKDKDKSDKDRPKDREKSDKDKEKEKNRHRDREKSEKDKDVIKKVKSDKEISSEKDRSKSHSGGSKVDKDKHYHSPHKDKHRHRDKDLSKERHGSHRDEKKKREERIDTAEPLTEVNASVLDGTVSLGQLAHSVKRKSGAEDSLKLGIKEEKMDDMDEDDLPLASRKMVYLKEEEDEDDKPLISQKVKVKVEEEKKKRKKYEEEEEDEDFQLQKKRLKKKLGGKVKEEKPLTPSASTVKGTKRKKEEEENVWKWWEEVKRDDGIKWKFLEHKGPVFADSYERLPDHVKFYYDGSHMTLSMLAEEVAGFYARMLDHDYTTKEIFNRNFFKDWRKVMTSKEKEKITDLKKCDFRKMHAYFLDQNELRRNRSKEEKKALKEKNEAIIAEYGWCTIDGHRQRIGNFKIEPPGLFRGRGEHPKQGMIKKRIMPQHVIINASKDSAIPKPPTGYKWKEVRHDNSVTWLACWNENIQGSTKYVMLNAASKLKGEKDWQKYEIARRLHKCVEQIRENYRQDWRSKEMRIRQRGVALYFIDKLALRAGNEKDEDQADTVGCCSLRVEHLMLYEQKDGKAFVVVFDFPGKDSIRYYNEVPVEKKVFKNLQLFMENKQEGDDVFDRLNTQILNKYLNELMEGLTAKVFRTYNASRTLQEQLEKLTQSGDPLPTQILTYNRANREVALLCNHQRSVPKTFEKSMANLQQKIDDKKDVIKQAERELKDSKRAAKHGGSVKEKSLYDRKKKALQRLVEQLNKLEISATDKEENKQIALGTSKLNYLDPRITVAWCKKNNIPVDKVYNKTQRQKFQWAIDMATADFNFLKEPTESSFGYNDDDDDNEDEDE